MILSADLLQWIVMLPMSTKVPHVSTPVVLLIGLFDPTGQQDVPADAITCANHGVHSVSAISGVSIADSANILHIDPIAPEMFDEQIRFLLEDTPVQAIKVGCLPAVEHVSVIAQIASDYPDVPLILHLGPRPPLEDPDELPSADTDLVAHASLELLVPQSELVVVSPNATDRWLNDDLTELMDVGSGPQALLHMGAQWVLLPGFRQRPGSTVYFLGHTDGLTVTWPWLPAPDRTQDTTGILACSIAAQIACAIPMQTACEAASRYESRTLVKAFQAGMGQKTANRMPGES